MRICECVPVAFSSVWICQNAFPSPKRVPIAFGGNWICQNALPSHWLLLGDGNAFWQIVFRLKATRTCLDIFSMALFSYWAFRCCSLPSCNLPVGSLFLILSVKVFLQWILQPQKQKMSIMEPISFPFLVVSGSNAKGKDLVWKGPPLKSATSRGSLFRAKKNSTSATSRGSLFWQKKIQRRRPRGGPYLGQKKFNFNDLGGVLI